MKDFVTDNITIGSGAYMFKFGFRHLLSSISENDNNIIKSLLDGIDTTNKVIILHGCQIDGTDPWLRNYTAGAVYYNGEIYPVDASTVRTVGTEVPFWKVDTVTVNSLFTDDVLKGWLVTRKMKLVSASAVSGVNLQRYDLTRRFEHIRFNKNKELYEVIQIPKLPSSTFLSENFDSDFKGKICTKYEGFALATGYNSTSDLAGIGIVGANFKNEALTNVRASGGTYLDSYWMLDIRNAIGNLVGKWKHKLTANQSGLRDHVHPISAYRFEGSDVDPTLEGDDSGESPRYRTYDSGGVSGGAQDAIDDTDLRQPVKISIIIQKVAEPVI